MKKAWNSILNLFEENGSTDEPLYDPVHVGGVVVGCMAGIGVLYWLLWSLLVCEGGIFTKIVPFFQVVFTSKILKDFGYEGYPYELGIFEGWIVNVVALSITAALITFIWRVFQPSRRHTDTPRKEPNES